MAQETLAQVFGANATQNANTLTITKADLASTGYTPTANDPPARILLALLINAMNNALNTTYQSTNPEIVVTISQNSYPTIINRNNNNYVQNSLTVGLEDLYSSSGAINPQDYL